MEKWTEKEIEVLKEYYEKFGPTYVAGIINRSARMISSRAIRLGLKYDSSKFYKSLEFDELVSKSKNFTDICKKLNLKQTGGNRITIKKWIKTKNLNTSHFFIERKQGKPKLSADIFIVNSITDRRIVKEKLFKNGLKEKKCEECGQDENWRGKKFSLILDHINGINNNNRLENLRILCPNCNATLDTHCGKNIKYKLKQIKKLN